MFILEIERDTVNRTVLTELQDHGFNGKLALAMAGYIQWLAPQLPSLRSEIRNEMRHLSVAVRTPEMHNRTPYQIASLLIGLKFFLEFAESCNAITSVDRQKLWGDGTTAIVEAGHKQSVIQEDEDLALKVMELIRGALASGKAHLADAKNGSIPKEPEKWGWTIAGNTSQQKGERMGWVNEAQGEIYCEPSHLITLLIKWAKEQNENIPISRNTLWKRMAEQNAILPNKSERKNTHKRTIEGVRKGVIVIPVAELTAPSPELPPDGTTNSSNGSRKQPVPAPEAMRKNEQGTTIGEYLQHHVASSTARIAEMVGTDEAEVEKIMEQAVETRTAIKDGKGTPEDPFLYRLATPEERKKPKYDDRF